MRLRNGLLLLLFPALLTFSTVTRSASAMPAILIQKTWGGTATDQGRGVAVDSSGNIYIAGTTNSFGPQSPTYPSMVLLKYNAMGALLWQRIWSGNDTNPYVDIFGVAVDSSGNAIVTGRTNLNGHYNVLIVKFDSGGNLLWQRVWRSGNNDSGQGVTVDGSGNVYITGSTAYGAGLGDILLLKLDSSGNLLWQRTWGGSNYDYGYGVAVDPSGNAYVTGYTDSFGLANHDHPILLKFDSSGNLLFQRIWDPSGSSGGVGYAVATDSSGSSYVTGITPSAGAGGFDAFVLKFDSTGGLLWQRTWGGASQDFGQGVASDTSGNIYVAGYTRSFGNLGSCGIVFTCSDAFLLKLDSSGNLIRQLTWGGASEDEGLGVAVDSYGSAVLTGFVSEAPPYSTGSGNNTLGLPSLAVSASGNSTLGMPTFKLLADSGTVGTPLGSQSFSGVQDVFLLKYGLLPEVTFAINPTAAGSIYFNGTVYTNGQNGNYTYGNATAGAFPSAGYRFASWTTSGGVTVANSANSLTVSSINGSGTLTANFTKIPTTPLTYSTLLLSLLTTSAVLTLRRRRLVTSTQR